MAESCECKECGFEDLKLISPKKTLLITKGKNCIFKIDVNNKQVDQVLLDLINTKLTNVANLGSAGARIYSNTTGNTAFLRRILNVPGQTIVTESTDSITIGIDPSYVPPTSGITSVNKANSQTINITGNGNGTPLVASARISSTAGNVLTSDSNGLYVPTPPSGGGGGYLDGTVF